MKDFFAEKYFFELPPLKNLRYLKCVRRNNTVNVVKKFTKSMIKKQILQFTVVQILTEVHIYSGKSVSAAQYSAER